MKKIIFIIFVGVFSASCCRWIPQRCITHTVDTLTVVKVDTFIITKDTLIYVDVPIPGETIRDSIPYPVIIGSDGLVNSDTLKMEVTLAKAWAVVENSILKGELIQKDTLIQMQVLLEDAIRETTILKDSITLITEQTTLIKTKAIKIRTILIGVILIMLLALLWKIFK